MQGKKDYQEKLFTNFLLSDRIPEENFYRRLKDALDLRFLYSLTKDYYGSCGQKSIDPVVFFKLSLVGYLENLISDRQLFPEAIFEQAFTKVLSMCVDAGMVSGHTQVIDSAPVKANARMDSLELKVPADELDEHLRRVRYMSSVDR